MSNGWIKLFTDGSLEDGSDELIDSNKASWSKGRLDNIKSVYINGNKYTVGLKILNTKWHQFDRYLTLVGSNESVKQLRVIQAQITKDHLGMYINTDLVHNITEYSLSKKPIDSLFKITNSFLNKWITIVGHEFNKRHYLLISEKGKV